MSKADLLVKGYGLAETVRVATEFQTLLENRNQTLVKLGQIDSEIRALYASLPDEVKQFFKNMIDSSILVKASQIEPKPEKKKILSKKRVKSLKKVWARGIDGSALAVIRHFFTIQREIPNLKDSISEYFGLDWEKIPVTTLYRKKPNDPIRPITLAESLADPKGYIRRTITEAARKIFWIIQATETREHSDMISLESQAVKKTAVEIRRFYSAKAFELKIRLSWEIFIDSNFKITQDKPLGVSSQACLFFRKVFGDGEIPDTLEQACRKAWREEADIPNIALVGKRNSKGQLEKTSRIENIKLPYEKSVVKKWLNGVWEALLDYANHRSVNYQITILAKRIHFCANRNRIETYLKIWEVIAPEKSSGLVV